jgi:hypothetical protein
LRYFKLQSEINFLFKTRLSNGSNLNKGIDQKENLLFYKEKSFLVYYENLQRRRAFALIILKYLSLI